MEKAVIGIVDTPEQAAAAVARLEAMGLPSSEISVLFPDRKGSHDFGFAPSSKWPEGALFGAAVGFALGAALGAAAGLGLFTVRGLELLTMAGPLLAALSGAAIGALLFANIGAVLGAAFPEIHAKHYAGKIATGGILVGVHVETADHAKNARAVLRSVEASRVRTTGEAALPHAVARAHEA